SESNQLGEALAHLAELNDNALVKTAALIGERRLGGGGEEIDRRALCLRELCDRRLVALGFEELLRPAHRFDQPSLLQVPRPALRYLHHVIDLAADLAELHAAEAGDTQADQDERAEAEVNSRRDAQANEVREGGHTVDP